MKLRIAGLLLALVLVLAPAVLAAENAPGTLSFAGLTWTPFTDTWKVTEAGLSNDSTDSNNTNIYTILDQKGDVLTYNWTITFGETTSATSGPMAGMHILGNNPEDGYRGSSLMVWQDQNYLRIYNSVDGKVPSGYRLDIPGVTVAPGETHSYRVIVNGKTGEVTVYRDEQLLQTWMPMAPITSGNVVSVRTNHTLATLKAFSFSAK